MAKKKEKIVCVRCGESGGKFVFIGESGWIHAGRCAPTAKSRNGLHANWPIVTTNVGDANQGPMVIENLQHLRRVEREYGVSSDAYNNDAGNR